MELFEKIYGRYYELVQKILQESRNAPLSKTELLRIAQHDGFMESALTIVPNLTKGVWPLLKENDNGAFTAILPHDLRYPLTSLQKSWLKALLEDKRIKLFLSDPEISRLKEELSDTTPLYDENDFHYFDQYKDGDAFELFSYREHFQMILTAFEEKRILNITYESKQGSFRNFELLPCLLQYSIKDNKFRLCGRERQRSGYKRLITLNLGKIIQCRICEDHFSEPKTDSAFAGGRQNESNFTIRKSKEPVVMLISGERNSLERCMLHFASYEKHTQYDERKKCFVCSIWYDMADETELLIDILSFGPVVKVIGPERFLVQIRERVSKQHELFYGKQENLI